MDREIDITVADGLIRVVYRGEVEYGASTTMLRRVGELAADQQDSHVLFDIRAANYAHYQVDAIRHAEEGPSLGIERSFRIAFLGAPGVPMLKYIEDVAVNRGYLARSFTDEPAALAWLQNSR